MIDVIIAGGGDDLRMSDLSIFDAGDRSYRKIGTLQVPRTEHTAVALRDGRVLILGGFNDFGELRSAEILGVASRRHAVIR